MKVSQDKDAYDEKFQLERIALFSDAVFAIAITLLIIEIRVPEIHSNDLTDRELWHNLQTLLPKFIGFFVSFFVIGSYWVAHHRMFRYIITSSHKLLWNNLLFLLPIVIMPFSTAFFSESFTTNTRLPLAIYTITICLAGFFSFRLWRIIGNPSNHLSKNPHKVILNYNSTRALLIPVIFILAFFLSFINTWISYIIPSLVPIAIFLVKKYFTRKYPAVMKSYLQ